jgi:oligopeptide transport permease C-like protein
VTAARLTATVEASGRSTPRAWAYLRRNPSFWIGFIGVVLIVGSAIFDT